MSTRKSLIACKVLRKRLDDIAITLQDHSIHFTSWLRAENVLTEAYLAVDGHLRQGTPDVQPVHDELNLMLNAVEADGSVYDKFLSYLKDEASLGHLAHLLQETYDLFAKSVPESEKLQDSCPVGQYESLPESVGLYIGHLKDIYMMDDLVYHQNILGKPKQFIEPVMVHKENEVRSSDGYVPHGQQVELSRNRIEMHEVGRLHDGSTACSILVEGAPGTGKTTFAWELCRRWKDGQLLHQFQMVLLLHLCNPSIQDANLLHDLVYHANPEVKRAVCDYLLTRKGKGVLIVLDGFDEISPSLCLQKKAIYGLLSKSLLPFGSVLVTTRPLATRQLPVEFLEKLDQHIEILGFGKKEIDAYVEHSCQKQPETLFEDFKLYLSSSPFSESVMFVPLHCSIITELYVSGWKKSKKGMMPATLTELYTSLVLNMVLQYLSLHPDNGKMEVEIAQLSDLPLKPQESLRQLAELAARGIEAQKYVFEEVPCDALEMGCVYKVNDVLTQDAPVGAYSFRHLTLQEYFAAVHWSGMPSGDLTALVRRPNLFPIGKLVSEGVHDQAGSTVRHWPTLLFLAGLTKLTGMPTSIIQSHFKIEPQADHTTKRVFSCSLSQLLFEAQNPSLLLQIFADSWFSAFGPSVLDSYVTGYCIAQSSSSAFWEVGYGSSMDIPSHMRSFVKGLSIPSTSRQHGQIRRFCFDIPELMEYLSFLPLLFQFLKDVRELFLVGELNKTNACSELLKLIPANFPHLEQLQIKSSRTSAEWIPLLESVSQFPRLNFVGLSITDQTDIPLIQLPQLTGVHIGLSFCSSLVVPNKYTLQTLQVQDIQLSSDDVAIVTELLGYMLSVLFMRNCTISDINFHRVTSAAAVSNCLKTFATIGNNIGIRGAAEIVVLMLQNSVIAELQILDDSITSDGATALLDSLADSCVKCLALPIKYTDFAVNYPQHLSVERVVLV